MLNRLQYFWKIFFRGGIKANLITLVVVLVLLSINWVLLQLVLSVEVGKQNDALEFIYSIGYVFALVGLVFVVFLVLRLLYLIVGRVM